MTETPPSQVTQLLVNWGKGDEQSLEALIPLVYDELRRQARRYLRRERPDHTLQSTALVHEAYVRLIDQRQAHWRNRSQFFGVAAQLIATNPDGPRPQPPCCKARSRRHQAGHRRRSGRARNAQRGPDRVGRSLKNLEKMDPQQSRIVELRFFSGLSIEDTADALGISTATVKRDWALAKAWLYREISGSTAREA